MSRCKVLDFPSPTCKPPSAPVEYAVIFRHEGIHLTFRAAGIADTPQDRLALANVLESAARNLRESAG